MSETGKGGLVSGHLRGLECVVEGGQALLWWCCALAPIPPSPTVCHYGTPMSPNLLLKWPREQKSHLGGRPKMVQKGPWTFAGTQELVAESVFLHLSCLSIFLPFIFFLILFSWKVTSNGLRVFCVQWAKSVLW